MRAGVRLLGSVAWPVVAGARRVSGARGLTLVGWHRVDGRSDGLSTGVDDFQRHLDTLDAWGAQVLPLDEAVAALAAGTLPERAVALTFDDGYASVVETAWPLLRARGHGQGHHDAEHHRERACHHHPSKRSHRTSPPASTRPISSSRIRQCRTCRWRTADHVVVIGRGRLLADTSVAELSARSPSLEEAFFELTDGSAEYQGKLHSRGRTS